jgi:hypothetical protein
LNLVSIGAGIGISIDADTQTYDQIPHELRSNIKTSFIFDLGEEAAEKIRDVVKDRSVTNFKQITDSYHLSALNNPGTFIYLGYGQTRATIQRNCLVGFWYPRARTAESETETNYYDLFKRCFPNRMVDISPLYARLLEINMDAQTTASGAMNEILRQVEQKKRKERKAHTNENIDKVLFALVDLCKKGSSHLDWGETVTALQFYQPEDSDTPILSFSRNHISNLLKKAQAGGFIVIEKSSGRGKWKIIINKEKITNYLKEGKELT